jgi:hypothetical protein
MVRPPDFDALYAADPDPWNVRDSWYERRKEAVLLALLSRERYDHAWDAASGTGSLARSLAGRCRHVTATDASPAAVRLTEHLLSGLPDTVAAVSRLPELPPLADAPDLVVLAEVLYYLSDEARAQSLDAVHSVTAPAAEVVAVHWRHHPDDAFLSGAAATEEADAGLQLRGWDRHSWHDDPDFVAASWVRR